MQIGSLVICPKGHYSEDADFILPASNDITYVVSEIKEVFPNNFGIQIEEKPKYDKNSLILWYEMKKFVEVQPPMDLSMLVNNSDRYIRKGKELEQECLELISQ